MVCRPVVTLSFVDGAVFISTHPERHFALNGEALGRDVLRGESALGRMEKEVNQGAIITFSEQIDSMLGSGVQLGRLASVIPCS
jgi:hypothetical protein